MSRKPIPVKLSQKRATTSERDMRVFHRSVNWAEWWEEWYMTLGKNGRPLYRRVFDFVSAKIEKKQKLQREFAMWYLGPPMAEGEASPFSWLKEGPQDWVTKRRTGGWYTPDNIKAFGVEIRRRMTALDALREVGNTITLHSLTRAEQLAQELDVSFQGRMFVDNLSWEANVDRAQQYIKLHKMLLDYKAQAQDLYAKAHGVNFDDMSGLTVLLQAAAISSVAAGADDKGKMSLNAVTEMILRKSQRYGMELPPGTVEVLESVEVKSAKKKGIQ